MIPIYPCTHRVLDIGEKSTGSRPDRARAQNFKYSRARAQNFYFSRARAQKKRVPAAPSMEPIDRFHSPKTVLKKLDLSDLAVPYKYFKNSTSQERNILFC